MSPGFIQPILFIKRLIDRLITAGAMKYRQMIEINRGIGAAPASVIEA